MTSIERRFFSIYFEKYRCKKILREFDKIEHIIDNLNSIINNRFNNLNLFETQINSISNIFNVLDKTLHDKNILLSFNNFIKVYNRLFNVKYNTRQILTAWMIFTCPEYILDIKLDDINLATDFVNLATNKVNLATNKVNLATNKYKRNIYYASEQLIYYFTNFSSISLNKFNKIIFEFNMEFNNFLQIDKIEKVYTYCNDWMEMEETIESIKKSKKYHQEEKDNIINNLIKTQDDIKTHIKIFNLDINYDELKKIAREKIKFKNLIQKEFKNEIELCFEEKKYDVIGEILDEIKQFILKFNKNNSDKINHVNEFFDVEYIIQLFRHDIITTNDINIFCMNTLSYILPHGSIALEKNKYEEWEYILSLNKNNKLNNFASRFIFFILEVINEIIEEITNLTNFISFKNLI